MAKTSKNTYRDPYFLKVVLYFILSTFWIRLDHRFSFSLSGFSVPLGLILGLMFASHEHFVIDKKIEFAILIVGTFVSYFLPMGVVLKW